MVRKLDYKTSEETNLLTEEKTVIHQPSSDVLQFYTESGNKISVRPSGTEPKIKFYISVSAILSSAADYDRVALSLNQKIKDIEKDILQS